jgi:hypothetical protein
MVFSIYVYVSNIYFAGFLASIRKYMAIRRLSLKCNRNGRAAGLFAGDVLVREAYDPWRGFFP